MTTSGTQVAIVKNEQEVAAAIAQYEGAPFKPGQFVVFKTPKTAEEQGERFRVVEMRGDRVLVQDADTYWQGRLSPQYAYNASDMVDEVEHLVSRIKAEILGLVAEGRIPATCASFSELHDYCDANMLGGGDNIDVDSQEFQDFCEQLNIAQNAVDAWIKAGGLKRPVIDTSGLSKSMAELVANRVSHLWCYLMPDGRTFYVSERAAHDMQKKHGGIVYPPIS